MKKFALLSLMMVFMTGTLVGCSKNKPVEEKMEVPAVQKTQDVGISVEVGPEKEESAQDVGVNIKVENAGN